MLLGAWSVALSHLKEEIPQAMSRIPIHMVLPETEIENALS
jgi:hypothetical protein